MNQNPGALPEMQNFAHFCFFRLNGLPRIVSATTARDEGALLGKMANRELARIDSLISQMLLVSSPAPAQKEQVRVHALLDYTLRLLQKQIEEKSIRVQNNHLADSDHVSGNGHQLQQALMNLI